MFLELLRPSQHGIVRDIRGRGLLVGVELDRPARSLCERLLARGILCKDTHENVIRLAPPLVIGADDLRWLAAEIQEALAEESH
jgi:ornithine--oxo-acid transaminase